MSILFHEDSIKYSPLTLTSDHPIKIRGKIWPTVKHYLYGTLYETSIYGEMLRKCDTSVIECILENIPDSELVNITRHAEEDILKEALMAKFKQYNDIKILLLETKNEKLIYENYYNTRWGNGRYNDGENRLGIILMDLRDELQYKEHKYLFCRDIEHVKTLHDKIHSLAKVVSSDIIDDLYPMEAYHISTLNRRFNLEADDLVGTLIDFYIYESEFGKINTKVYDKDNNVIADLNSAEALYDYIVQSKK